MQDLSINYQQVIDFLQGKVEDLERRLAKLEEQMEKVPQLDEFGRIKYENSPLWVKESRRSRRASGLDSLDLQSPDGTIFRATIDNAGITTWNPI